MGRVRFVQLGVALALGLSGCQWFGGGEDETVVVQPVPTAAPNQPASAGPKAPSISTLIQPTNPDERLRVIRGGRVDPFAALVPGTSAPSSGGGTGNAGPVTATAGGSSPDTTVIRTGPTSTVVRVRPASGTQADIPSSPSRSTAGSDSSPGPTASQTRSPGSQPNSSGSDLPDLSTPDSEVTLPPLPQPDLAKGVQVTGFVVLNGIPRAIVKAPNERVSRSVVAGDFLADGQVLVKGIDFANSNEPVLILEEAGTEVAVAAGKSPVQLASAAENLPPIPALW